MAKVRISIGNLAQRIHVVGEKEPRPFGLLNRKSLEAGKRVFTAVGGAALMTEAGKFLLENDFFAEFQEGLDARFLIDDRHLNTVLSLFEDMRNGSLYETDPIREIEEELSEKELPIQDRPILEKSDLGLIQIRYVLTYRQPTAISKDAGSAREGEYPTHRLFNVFDIHIPESLLPAFQNAEAVRFFTPEEIATTEGGRRNGISADGQATIGSNLFSV